jgi:hypothetical protein
VLAERARDGRAGTWRGLRKCPIDGCRVPLLVTDALAVPGLAAEDVLGFAEVCAEAEARSARLRAPGSRLDPVKEVGMAELRAYAAVLRDAPQRYTMCPLCATRVERTDGCDTMQHACAEGVSCEFCFCCGYVISRNGVRARAHANPCPTPNIRLLGMMDLSVWQAAKEGSAPTFARPGRGAIAGVRTAAGLGVPVRLLMPPLPHTRAPLERGPPLPGVDPISGMPLQQQRQQRRPLMGGEGAGGGAGEGFRAALRAATLRQAEEAERVRRQAAYDNARRDPLWGRRTRERADLEERLAAAAARRGALLRERSFWAFA